MGISRDLSGTPLPPPPASIRRALAIPPVLNEPNVYSQEFLWQAYGTLAAAGGAFVALDDAETATPFAQLVPAQNMAKIATIFLYCPDMVAAAAPYLAAQITVNNSRANAWGFISIAPRTGAAALSFRSELIVSPGQTVRINGLNTDAANAHMLTVNLYGWLWNKDAPEGGL